MLQIEHQPRQLVSKSIEPYNQNGLEHLAHAFPSACLATEELMTIYKTYAYGIERQAPWPQMQSHPLINRIHIANSIPENNDTP